MSTVQNMNNVNHAPVATCTTFQHAPYGYNAVPARFRTIQSLTPPRSPPSRSTTTVVTLGDSLGALSAESDSDTFDAENRCGHTEVDCQYPFPQHHTPLPPAVQHFRPNTSNTVAIPLAASRTASGVSSNTVYDQSAMPPPPPPSYTVALSPAGANPSSPTVKEQLATGKSNNFPRPQPLNDYHSGQSRQDGHISRSDTSAQTNSRAAPGKTPTTVVGAMYSSFKAHHYLEKAGVTYHQFPNGGNLSTPDHWPQHCTIDGSSSYPNTHRAFIGQVRFETTTEQIAWVLEQVTGVTAAFVAYHRNGCFVAHFLSKEECDRAVSHHKKILFDLNGVWDVQFDFQSDVDGDAHKAAVLQQVLKNKPNLHKHRLPRGCMVIEPFASTRNEGGVPTFPHHQRQQQSLPLQPQYYHTHARGHIIHHNNINSPNAQIVPQQVHHNWDSRQ